MENGWGMPTREAQEGNYQRYLRNYYRNINKDNHDLDQNGRSRGGVKLFILQCI